MPHIGNDVKFGFSVCESRNPLIPIYNLLYQYTTRPKKVVIKFGIIMSENMKTLGHRAPILEIWKRENINWRTRKINWRIKWINRRINKNKINWRIIWINRRINKNRMNWRIKSIKRTAHIFFGNREESGLIQVGPPSNLNVGGSSILAISWEGMPWSKCKCLNGGPSSLTVLSGLTAQLRQNKWGFSVYFYRSRSDR